MIPISSVTSHVVALDRSDVDTDQIIPASWLKRVERTGFGEGLFSQWRKDPEFVLNQPSAVTAKILVTGPNFGTGSSREHAVWAIEDWGFRAVISPKFGDIFRNNCTKVGVIPAQVTAEFGRHLLDQLAANPDLEVTVDIQNLEVRVPALEMSCLFPMDEFTQHRFIEGLDDIGLTLTQADEIAAFEERRSSFFPTSTT